MVTFEEDDLDFEPPPNEAKVSRKLSDSYLRTTRDDDHLKERFISQANISKSSVKTEATSDTDSITLFSKNQDINLDSDFPIWGDSSARRSPEGIFMFCFANEFDTLALYSL